VPWMIRYLGNTRPSKVETIVDAMDRLMQNNVGSYKKYLSGTGQENPLLDSWCLNVFKGEMHPSLADFVWKLRIGRGAHVRINEGAELRDIGRHIGDAYHSAVVIEGQSRTIAPGRLCKVLAELAVSQGVVMKRADVQSIQLLLEAGYKLECYGETITVQRLVVAGGIWSAE
jgi:D-amino-acid dehydrogenase